MRRWRERDGSWHVVIEGDGAPPAVAPADRRDERFSVQASLRRSEIERRLQQGTAALAAKRREIRETREMRYEIRPLPTPTDEEERQRVEDIRRNAVLAAAAFEEGKRRRLFLLHREEKELLDELAAAWRDFARLGDEVAARYGGAPTWWRPRLRCPGCPSAGEVAEQLVRNEVERGTRSEPTAAPAVVATPPPAPSP